MRPVTLREFAFITLKPKIFRAIIAICVSFISFHANALVAYSHISLHGYEDSDLKMKLKSLEKKEKYDNEASGQSIIKEKTEIIEKSLKESGYYAANIQKTSLLKNKNKLEINFQITPGPLFKIDGIVIKHAPNTNIPEISSLEIKKNDALIAEKVVNAAKILAAKIEDLNCFTEINVQHLAIIDFENHTADLQFSIKEQPQVNFGTSSYIGLTTVSKEYIERQQTWQIGSCFKPTKIKRMQSNLRKSNLFSQVDISYPDELQENELVPIMITVKERPPRTIKLGTGYESDKGLGLYLGWQHRNVFGEAETVDLNGKANLIEQNIELIYKDPYFRHENQSLTSRTQAERIDSDQYESISLQSELSIARKLKPHWQLQYGLGYRLSQVEEIILTEQYGLLYLPLAITYDSRLSLIDPREGMYCRLSFSPYWDTFGHVDLFYKSRFDMSQYWSLNASQYTVLATRLALGSISGPPRTKIPADLRFYAGGGHSVRGYEYQLLGLVEDDVALGGRSLFEVSLELRQQISEQYGLVVFLDGGNVFEKSLPDFSQTIRFAAGLGARYYTSFGPIRFDIAFPINKRPNLDKSYQFYISIGQSF